MDSLIPALKAHVALNVRDVAKSVDFYRNLFGIEPARLRPGYAKFDVTHPPLNLSLNQGKSTAAGALVTAVSVALGIIAFTYDGFTTTDVDLNDGGVWVTKQDSQQLGRINVQAEELDAGLISPTASFDVLQDEIKEGRDLFRSRVTPDIFGMNIYDRALVDVLIKSKGHVKSKIW